MEPATIFKSATLAQASPAADSSQLRPAPALFVTPRHTSAGNQRSPAACGARRSRLNAAGGLSRAGRGAQAGCNDARVCTWCFPQNTSGSFKNKDPAQRVRGTRVFSWFLKVLKQRDSPAAAAGQTCAAIYSHLGRGLSSACACSLRRASTRPDWPTAALASQRSAPDCVARSGAGCCSLTGAAAGGQAVRRAAS